MVRAPTPAQGNSNSYAFLGYAVMWWSWQCSIALAMLAVALRVIVLVEEEHLERTFGDAHRAYRRRVPRWLGLTRRGTI